MIADPHKPFALAREDVLRLIEREQVTVFPAVPFVFRALAEGGIDADLSSVRLCFSAGNALPRSTFDAFDRAFGVPIRQLYGLTETGAVTINVDDDPWRDRRVGRHADAGDRGRGARRRRERARDRPDR